GADVGKPRRGLPGDVDRRAGAVDEIAGTVPDPDDELVLELAFQQRARLVAVARTDIDRDLLQLGVEELVHLIRHQRERGSGRDDAHGGHHCRRPHGDGPAQRVHEPALVTIQPAPRMLWMMSLPYFLRRPWITTSTALLCTSSLQP